MTQGRLKKYRSEKLRAEFSFPNFDKACNWRTQKRGGGGQKRGGGQNLTRRPPTENSFRTPHLGMFCPPPPPNSISLSQSLRNAQNFPQLTTSKAAFGGSRKMVSDGPCSRGFAFRYVLDPFSSAQCRYIILFEHCLS